MCANNSAGFCSSSANCLVLDWEESTSAPGVSTISRKVGHVSTVLYQHFLLPLPIGFLAGFFFMQITPSQDCGCLVADLKRDRTGWAW